MLKALIRFVFFVLPEFFFSAAAAIIFERYEINGFSLNGLPMPPSKKDMRILKKHLEICFALVDSDIKKAGQDGKKETDN